jgi:seryl-tRNA synthetase
MSATHEEFLGRLIAARLLIPCGVDGVYGRGDRFEAVCEGIDRYVTQVGAGDGAERIRFPPVVTRANFERSDYLKSFPDLAGVVYGFEGKDREHQDLLRKLERGEDWTAGLVPTDVVMTPAACYPIYPTLSGVLPQGGRRFDVLSYCFRHEPSTDPARMQLFRMHEQVRVGSPDEVRSFRALWQERGTEMLRSLGLQARVDVAHDPFFGRAGRMLAANQRDQALKFELLVPICSAEKPTACVSLNYHQDHFGQLFGIQLPGGATAHTACVGFGLERIALALFARHGTSIDAWPVAVRRMLDA